MFQLNQLDAIQCGPLRITTMWSILIALNSLDAITNQCGMFQLNQMDVIRCGPICFVTMQSILIALFSLDVMQCDPFLFNSI